MAGTLKEEIIAMYKSIDIHNNDICKECNRPLELEYPVSFYYVGDKFHTSDDTILFVGKTAVGGEFGEYINNAFFDVTEFGRQSLDLEEPKSKTRAIFNYTHEIIKRYYGSYEIGKQFVALSNIVKCNNGSTEDETTPEIMENCINNLGVIWKEVEILQAKRIIFYTGRDYDDYIDTYQPKDSVTHKNLVDDIQNCWWHKRFYKEDLSISCDILRTVHPQRKTKEDFVLKVITWLNQTKE